jgi:hypothetical protein
MSYDVVKSRKKAELYAFVALDVKKQRKGEIAIARARARARARERER